MYHLQKILDWMLNYQISRLCIFEKTMQKHPSREPCETPALIVISQMKQDFKKIFQQCYETFAIPNQDKCCFLTLEFQDAQPNFSYDNFTIYNVSGEKILGITIDNKLTLENSTQSSI